MDDERSLRIILEWSPPGRRRKGRPPNAWMQEVGTGVRERGINNVEGSTKKGGEEK